MSKRTARFCLVLSIAAAVFTLPAAALPVSFWIDAESGAAFTGYNDVQIPADTGTRFSLADDLSPETVPFLRLQAGIDFGRHSVFALYAPLRVESTGSTDEDIDFFGETFSSADELTATYVFNSYRLTYAYTFFKDKRFEIAAGLTGKIRDASIAVDDGTTEAKRSNLGFVPLIHLSVEWFIAPQVSLLLRGDGLAAPQGRAEDFLLAAVWSPAPDLDLRLGYRLLEGGSDGGGSVYTFSMFHYLSAGVRYRYSLQ
jgi:hypothetical protein